jgi:hypothetical protein
MENFKITNIEKTNVKIGEDGVEEFDLNITALFYPKAVVKNINIEFEISPTEVNLK